MALFDFEESDIKYIRTLKQDRIQVQYYLEKIYLEDENNVRKFIFKCKQILNDLNSSKIENARKLLESEC